MLRSIVSSLVAAPILVVMGGCSNEPATPSVDGSAPMATETPQCTPTATAGTVAIPATTYLGVPPPITPVIMPVGTLTSPTFERAALVALYEATGGSNWANNSNWLSDRPLGEWYGVITDVSGRVTRLSLHLSGSIPAELGSLANLQRLHLYDNQLSGPIPVELGNLANLEGLWLFQNQLSGPIPAELGSLSNLCSSTGTS